MPAIPGSPAVPAVPDVVTRYLAAHEDRDAPAALATMHEDATVTDEGSTHTGSAEIGRWLETAASEYTYTTELVAAESEDDAHHTVTHRLEGNFPGGRVDLRFRFTLRDGLIEDLTIAP
ncbi:nuclear transport factor 2 family protein [Streptomyces sp. NBC_01716]|uniref:nuclear transport factor 2 family protein n=1 Tax=Streptomyces sp. NBC_01716 TaxID=2975917 RepID=UPI002E357FD3|nr:nuclear transport factor 2 family protein [Streptomyces sp. NBC_01716]